MFFYGFVGPVGNRESDAGEHLHERDADDGETGFGMDDHSKRHQCGGESSGGRRGNISEVCRSSGEGMSGIESAEREDYDGCQAGVAAVSDEVRQLVSEATEDLTGNGWPSCRDSCSEIFAKLALNERCTRPNFLEP